MRTNQICKITFALLFIAINTNAQTVTQYYQNGKLGYKNSVTGQVIVAPRYSAGSNMTQSSGSGTYCAVVFEGNKAGYINERGEVIIPFTYDDGSVFSEGVARVKSGSKNGYIDIKNKTIISFEYDFAADFKNGIARVEKDGKWGFIDLTGKTVIAFQFFNAGEFSEGMAPVMAEKGNWGFINAQGNFVIQPSYTKAESFRNGEALVHNGEKFIYIDTQGNFLRDMSR